MIEKAANLGKFILWHAKNSSFLQHFFPDNQAACHHQGRRIFVAMTTRTLGATPCSGCVWSCLPPIRRSATCIHPLLKLTSSCSNLDLRCSDHWCSLGTIDTMNTARVGLQVSNTLNIECTLSMLRDVKTDKHVFVCRWGKKSRQTKGRKQSLIASDANSSLQWQQSVGMVRQLQQRLVAGLNGCLQAKLQRTRSADKPQQPTLKRGISTDQSVTMHACEENQLAQYPCQAPRYLLSYMLRPESCPDAKHGTATSSYLQGARRRY